jgi:hypothetical protein
VDFEMSAQSALGSGTWVAARRRNRHRRRERPAIPTGWNDPFAAAHGFIANPIERVPGPGVGVPLPRYRPRSLARSAGRFLFKATLAILAVAIVAGAGAVAPYLGYRDEVRRADDAAARVAATAADLDAATATVAQRSVRIAAMRDRIALLQAQIEEVRLAKVRTVVETETVTEEVVRWVPNGEGVAVEITGFEGVIGIHDVQITQAYGFTDIVGIAVNESGHTISYAQLGCTFLDEDGKVLANAITNKQGWAPEQSWGFTCSAQVDSTGGILRVDEMS